MKLVRHCLSNWATARNCGRFIEKLCISNDVPPSTITLVSDIRAPFRSCHLLCKTTSKFLDQVSKKVMAFRFIFKLDFKSTSKRPLVQKAFVFVGATFRSLEK